MIKPWSMRKAMLWGLVIGTILWWSAYEAGAGLLQKPQLIVAPPAIGAFIVNWRNKRRRVGPYDPETLARNKRGRL